MKQFETDLQITRAAFDSLAAFTGTLERVEKERPCISKEEALALAQKVFRRAHAYRTALESLVRFEDEITGQDAAEFARHVLEVS